MIKIALLQLTACGSDQDANLAIGMLPMPDDVQEWTMCCGCDDEVVRGLPACPRCGQR